MNIKPAIIVVTGPTGIGKSDIAFELARKYNTEIISSDSRQIYKELNIGTAVPSAQMLNSIPHHFIQNISIHDYYNASMFEQEAMLKLEQLFNKHKVVIVAGGSMLYIDSLCNGIDDIPTVNIEIRNNLIRRLNSEGNEQLLMELQVVDPDYYQKMDKRNNKRLLHALEIYQMTGKPYSSFLTQPKKERPFNIIKIGLNTDRAIVYNRINQRVDRMIELGLMEEAETVYSFRNLNSLNTVGYKELFSYFDNVITQEQAIEQIKAHTRKYARKQLTWYRKDKEINWFDPKNREEIAYFVHQKLEESK